MLTKERRDELRAALRDHADPWLRTSIIVEESGGIYSNPLLRPSELRALLDSDERLEAARGYLEPIAAAFVYPSSTVAREALAILDAEPPQPKSEPDSAVQPQATAEKKPE